MRSGSTYLNGTKHKVITYVRHEKYITSDDDYDICVVKVHLPFKKHQVVKLPELGQQVNLNSGVISGWGQTKVHFCFLTFLQIIN